MPKKQVIVLSDDAVAFKNTPAILPVVEDIYAIGDNRAWIVVCTEVSSETKAEKNLQERVGISTFLPVERSYVRKEIVRTTMVAGMVSRQRQKTVRRPVYRPLLPGYIFAQVPVAGNKVPDPVASRILHLDGVASILGSVSGPIPISDAFISLLRREQGLGTFDRTTSKPKWAKTGERVKIADGPFSSFMAVIEECLPNDLLRVGVEMFGRSTPVTLELAQIEKAC